MVTVRCLVMGAADADDLTYCDQGRATRLEPAPISGQQIEVRAGHCSRPSQVLCVYGLCKFPQRRHLSAERDKHPTRCSTGSHMAVTEDIRSLTCPTCFPEHRSDPSGYRLPSECSNTRVVFRCEFSKEDWSTNVD